MQIAVAVLKCTLKEVVTVCLEVKLPFSLSLFFVNSLKPLQPQDEVRCSFLFACEDFAAPASHLELSGGGQGPLC